MNLKKFININWYINHKPYSTHTRYDLFYLNLYRSLYGRIEKVAKAFTDTIRS